jgi:hypothetical protein
VYGLISKHGDRNVIGSSDDTKLHSCVMGIIESYH